MPSAARKFARQGWKSKPVISTIYSHGTPSKQAKKPKAKQTKKRTPRQVAVETAWREAQFAHHEKWGTHPTGSAFWPWYQSYLQSPEWITWRAHVIKQRTNRCQSCNISGKSSTLQLHHITYENVGCVLRLCWLNIQEIVFNNLGAVNYPERCLTQYQKRSYLRLQKLPRKIFLSDRLSAWPRLVINPGFGKGLYQILFLACFCRSSLLLVL